MGGVLAIGRALVGLVGRRWLPCAWIRRRYRIAVVVALVLVTALEIWRQPRVDLYMAAT